MFHDFRGFLCCRAHLAKAIETTGPACALQGDLDRAKKTRALCKFSFHRLFK